MGEGGAVEPVFVHQFVSYLHYALPSLERSNHVSVQVRRRAMFQAVLARAERLALNFSDYIGFGVYSRTLAALALVPARVLAL